MKVTLKTITGHTTSKVVDKYLIKWDKKSRSKLQFEVKQFLKPYWCHQICFEEFPVYGSMMRVDLLNITKKIAVEVNGPQHGSYVHFFHETPANYLKSIKRDWRKTEWLELNGFQLVELEEKDVKKLNYNPLLKFRQEC